MKASILTLLSVAFLVCLISFSTSCGRDVRAAAPLCGAEFFSPLAGHTYETHDGLWFTTAQACDIETEEDETYTLLFDHDVQNVIGQMGSNMGSVFEWDVIVTITLPDGRQTSIQQQYDKHNDQGGNRQINYPLQTPWHLPAGTTVNLHRRKQPATACITAGPWDGTVACATGQSVQFLGTLQ